MQILTVPHPTLREKAIEVTEVTSALEKFVADIEATLATARRPRGVGLAATQVGKLHRAFVLAVDDTQTLINPRITKKSHRKSFGMDADEPTLEGCLSIPMIYGPVPRWEWVEMEYQELVDGKLVDRKTKFVDFAARVAQHELDHLDGILFTDYTLEFGLPVYQENAKTKDLEEIDHTLLKFW